MSTLPDALTCLLAAPTDLERGNAWQRFVAEHSRLLLHVARTVTSGYDDAMDAYAHVLEQLTTNDYARLRKFASDRPSKFTTWLVVVSRRLCLDEHRRRYGRAREDEPDRVVENRAFRRRLEAFVADESDAADLAERDLPADEWLIAKETQQQLDAALATLSDTDRLLLKYRFDDDLSAQRIATLMHFPSHFHVYRRITQVAGRLRAILLAKGIENAAS